MYALSASSQTHWLQQVEDCRHESGFSTNFSDGDRQVSVRMSHHHFKLYVMGKTARSNSAIENLKRFCDEEIPDSYELAIIDVLEDPRAAELDKIFATPTLIKHEPPPARRIIGDLAERAQVIRMLNLDKPRINQ